MKLAQLTRAALVAAATFATLSTANAQSSSPIKLIVGFPAGGAVDTIARAFAEQVRLQQGLTMIVENRPGASGKIAIDTLQSSPADGMTVLIAPASLLELGPMVLPSMQFDAIRDFTPIGVLADYGFAIVAGPASGTRDIASYRLWAEANPLVSSFATPGQGTPQHFLGEQLKKALSVELVHIPYKGGADAVKDVMGGQVPMLITTEQVVVPYEDQGKLNTLFITSRKRNPRMPEVSTAREVGLSQLESVDWFGAFLKLGTPDDKVRSWKVRVEQIVASPSYAETMNRLGYGVPEQQPVDFTALLASERDAWAERVRLSGFNQDN